MRKEAISNLNSWHEALAISKRNGGERAIARDKLLQLLISHYAARQQNPIYLEIRQDLEQRRLFIPDSAYKFLFLSESQKPAHPSLRTLYQAVRRWYRRMRGQEEAEFNQVIDELIDFMKS